MKIKNKVKPEEYLIQGNMGEAYVQWTTSDKEGKLKYNHGTIRSLPAKYESFLLHEITAKLEDFLPFLLSNRFNSSIIFTIYDTQRNKIVSFSPSNSHTEIENLLGYLPTY